MTLAGLIIMIALTFGGIGLITSLVLIVWGTIYKRKGMQRFGYFLSIIPLVALIVLLFIDLIFIPKEHEQETQKLVGFYTSEYYHPISPDSIILEKATLHLREDGTYTSQHTDFLNLPNSGSWKNDDLTESVILYNERGKVAKHISKDIEGLAFNSNGISVIFICDFNWTE